MGDADRGEAETLAAQLSEVARLEGELRDPAPIRRKRRPRRPSLEGWGLNFSLARTLGERLVPFLRMGWSDGGLTALEAVVASGLGIESSQGDQLGVGASWGRPAEGGLRDQYTAEVFYRLQVTSDFAVTPNVQVILDPAANPAESSIVVYSLRAGIPI